MLKTDEEIGGGERFQWMCGDTKLDMIRNERIRCTKKAVDISTILQERRLKWKCDAKRGVITRKEGYVNGSTKTKEEGMAK